MGRQCCFSPRRDRRPELFWGSLPKPSGMLLYRMSAAHWDRRGTICPNVAFDVHESQPLFEPTNGRYRSESRCLVRSENRFPPDIGKLPSAAATTAGRSDAGRRFPEPAHICGCRNGIVSKPADSHVICMLIRAMRIERNHHLWTFRPNDLDELTPNVL